MKKRLLIIAALLLAPTMAHSQLISHKGVVPGSYDFWVWMPEGRSSKDTTKLPLVLFLHGKSLSGNDLERVRRYGPLDALRFGRKIDAIILAPQAQGGWQPSKVKKALDWTEEHYPVDTSRIYVFGMSMGGYGTLDFTGTYPDKVAAAIAMCGGADIKDVSGLNKVPLWIIHGTSDAAVSHRESQRVVDAMKASGPADLLRFDLLDGVNHARLGRVFYMKEPYEWLFSHSLADSLRTLNTEVQITKAGIADAYKGLPGRRNLKVVAYRGGKKAAPRPFRQAQGPDGVTQGMTKGEDEVVAEEAQSAAGEQGRTASGQDSVRRDSTYTIRKGDTLSKISKKTGTSIDELCEKNGITRTTILRIGRKLKL